MRVTIDGRSLRLEHAEHILAGRPIDPRLSSRARRRMEAARRLVLERAAGDDPVYGVNTGFGKLSLVRIPPEESERLQENLLISHAAGVGPTLDGRVARLALLLRANALAAGHSGVRIEIVERLLAILSSGAEPIVPEQGSVGASGDLAPLAHLALLVIGRGRARLDGRVLGGRSLLARLGLEPLRLEPKEGLALINGTQVSTALALAGLIEGERLARCADVALSLTIEALRGSVRPFDARIQRLRPHPGQRVVAANVRRLLRRSRVVASHRRCGKVQDPYALRCAPQVHGAARDALDHVRRVLEREMNAVTDNPLVFPERGDILSGGNFHAEPVALAADHAACALAEFASISERRTENLVNPDLSGLPAFLARNPGLESGLMMAQVTAAALVSENKTLAHPASVDSIPTSGGKEDHVSMATWAARKFVLVARNVRRVLAIELLAAAQALECHDEWIEPGVGARAAYDAVRRRVAPRDGDTRPLEGDIETLARAVADGSLLAEVEQAAGRIR